MTETTIGEREQVAALAAIRTRYAAIAPPPETTTPGLVALVMARWLTLAAQRGLTRTASPYTPDQDRRDAEVRALFGMLHLLGLVTPARREKAVREILAAWDGADMGTWLSAVGAQLGVNTEEVERLANREARIEAGPAPRQVHGPVLELSEADTLAKIAGQHERVMVAAAIDLKRGDPAAAARLISWQLDGWEGPAWDGKQTGLQWLTETRTEAGQ